MLFSTLLARQEAVANKLELQASNYEHLTCDAIRFEVQIATPLISIVGPSSYKTQTHGSSNEHALKSTADVDVLSYEEQRLRVAIDQISVNLS